MEAEVRGNERVIDLGAGRGALPAINSRVRGLKARVKKIATTDEGKLQVTLETEGLDYAALEQVKELLVLQQACPVVVNMDPVQRDLFDA